MGPHVLKDSMHSDANNCKRETKIILLIIADLTVYISILCWFM